MAASPMAETIPQLRDIHLPAEPSAWPPAPGWWVLGLLSLAAVVALLWLLRRHLRRRRRQRRLIAELDRLQPSTCDAAAVPVYLAALSQFLRRLARAVRADAANLRGEEWIQFLDRHGDGFHAYAGALNDAAWRQQASVDVKALHALARGHLQRVLRRELRDV
ncbi:DUF4381 domain-containing protein [Tahibacter sp.]|uniref:DUF4381 domain-containing protein n=1 Tax=Tahibacter sp. TaxID=2056211 RepID=UPI0028C38EC0|nr:DUF4381 domain-containing protein [Tahibacter sp.]